jgi:hypothetical protein
MFISSYNKKPSETLVPFMQKGENLGEEKTFRCRPVFKVVAGLHFGEKF